jgi:hypothetical protein
MKNNLHTNQRTAASRSFIRLISTVGIVTALLTPRNLFAQSIVNNAPDTMKTVAKQTYPKVVGYLSFILPIVTVSNSTTYNFSKSTGSIGFPVGINVLYSDRFGFSYEITPTIKSSGGTSKTSNLLFDPGTMFRFDHGFTIITRLAFETEGRYGFTPVFNQVYARTKDVNYFVALSLPTRFGDSEAASIGLNLQIGFIFN